MLNTSMKVMQSKGISVWLLPPFLFSTIGIYSFVGHKLFLIVKIEIIMSNGHNHWSGEWDLSYEWYSFLIGRAMVLEVGRRQVFYDPIKDFDMPKVSFFKMTDYFFQRAKLLQIGNTNKTQKPMYLKRKEDQLVGPAEPL